jgi:hypothetical protein
LGLPHSHKTLAWKDIALCLCVFVA